MTLFLLKLTLAWGLFALLYTLLLRRETFFRANRFYLLCAAAAGILFALPGAWFFQTGADSGLAVALPIVTVGLSQAEVIAAQWNWPDYLWVLYGAGATMALLRMLWGLLRLATMISRGKKERLSDACILVRSSGARVPFSFFYWVFVPEKASAECAENISDAMLAHERAHARGWHSADVLLLELLCIVFWFHPLAHWYRRALRTVHEYLADADAASRTDKKQYGLLLIRQVQPGLSFALVNHFFQSPVKQRIIMLMQRTSPVSRAWKYGLVAPLFCFLLLLKYQAPAQVAKEAQGPKENTVYTLKDIDQQPRYPGGEAALIKFLSENIRYPDAARRDSAQGMVVVLFTIDKTGIVTDVGLPSGKNQALQEAGWRQDFMDEAVRVVKRMPKWEPARTKNRAVDIRYTLPIRFRLQ